MLNSGCKRGGGVVSLCAGCLCESGVEVALRSQACIVGSLFDVRREMLPFVIIIFSLNIFNLYLQYTQLDFLVLMLSSRDSSQQRVKNFAQYSPTQL